MPLNKNASASPSPMKKEITQLEKELMSEEGLELKLQSQTADGRERRGTEKNTSQPQSFDNTDADLNFGA
jgi:hypothetical protein